MSQNHDNNLFCCPSADECHLGEAMHCLVHYSPSHHHYPPSLLFSITAPHHHYLHHCPQPLSPTKAPQHCLLQPFTISSFYHYTPLSPTDSISRLTSSPLHSIFPSPSPPLSLPGGVGDCVVPLRGAPHPPVPGYHSPRRHRRYPLLPHTPLPNAP